MTKPRETGGRYPQHSCDYVSESIFSLTTVVFVVGPLQRVRPRNGILALGLVLVLVVLPLRSEFIGEL